MLRIFSGLCLLFFSTALIAASHATDTGVWVTYTVQKGDFAAKIFNQYELFHEMDVEKFWSLNEVANKDVLLLGKTYKLPIKSFTHKAVSIRQTLGIDDYNHALSIQKWNEKLERNKLKTQRLVKDKVLWVRYTDLPSIFKTIQSAPAKTNFNELIDTRLFTSTETELVVKDTSLRGAIFYLISGHGGPDPGSNIMMSGHLLCEDEYAYDVTLRLAKSLAQKGAKVFMIVQDTTHGIRADAFLKHDRTETVYGGKVIPLNQVQRLKQRTDMVNTLFEQYKHRSTYHRCIEIHVDSRNKKEQIDVFFYHFPGSKLGQRLCENMQQTFKSKYDTFQKGRGYNGEIKTRNLFTLSNTKPVTCYIELGNIQHERDRQRILKAENRQALAEWMTEAIVKDKESR
jgi:N-acetylmuramoyl-L-alanine amidase